VASGPALLNYLATFVKVTSVVPTATVTVADRLETLTVPAALAGTTPIAETAVVEEGSP